MENNVVAFPKPVCYLSGPMRGIESFNFPAFLEAAVILAGRGYHVLNPAEKDIEHGFNPTGMTGLEDLADYGFDLRAALAWDMGAVLHADFIVLLPNWRSSAGAKAEYALARAIGIEAFELQGEDLVPTPPLVALRV